MKAKSLKTHTKRGVEHSEPILVESSMSKISFIDSLIHNSVLNDDQIKDIHKKISGFLSDGEADDIIRMLLDNQIDPIESGNNYGQREILIKLKQLRWQS